MLLLFFSQPLLAADWRYRLRPGDTPWDVARKYVRSDIHHDRVLAYNRIGNPHGLPPGTVLAIPVAWLKHQPMPARVVAANGAATASLDGRFGRSLDATAGLALPAGAALRTAPDASLTLEFADGSRVRMHGGSELFLMRLDAYGDTGIFNIRLRLPRGRITHLVRPRTQPASRYVVETPGMMSSVRGTEFRSASEGGRSFSEVLTGRVEARGQGRGVMLGAGLGTATDAEGRPAPATALLPAPDLSALPAHLLRLPASVAWPAVEGAVGYRLEASAHEDFRTLMLQQRVDKPNASLQLQHEGDLYLRVRAIAENGLEGLDAQARTEIARQPSPPFALSPADADEVAGPRPRLRWTASEQAGLRYRVALIAAGGDFAAPLFARENITRTDLRIDQDLAPGQYQWRIAATDATGKQGSWSLPIPFTVLPPGEGPGASAGTDGGVLKVRWDKGSEGQRFRFQLARDAGFEKIRIDRVLAENSIELPEIRSGKWYLRVMVVEEDGFEHPPGPTQMVKLGCTACRIAAGAGAALLLVL